MSKGHANFWNLLHVGGEGSNSYQIVQFDATSHKKNRVVLVGQRTGMAFSHAAAYKLNFDLMKMMDANISDIKNYIFDAFSRWPSMYQRGSTNNTYLFL